MESGGWFFFLVVVGFLFWVLHQWHEGSNLRKAHRAYRESLERLKERPSDPDLRQVALNRGRYYSNLTRKRRGVTVYDEVAISNDIGAACASANQAPSSSGSAASAPLEARLNRLKQLYESGAIEEHEYRDRRSKLLEEI